MPEKISICLNRGREESLGNDDVSIVCARKYEISPLVWNTCENLHYESVYFKELHNEQEYYWPTIHRAGAAVASTITSYGVIVAYFINDPERYRGHTATEYFQLRQTSRSLQMVSYKQALEACLRLV